MWRWGLRSAVYPRVAFDERTNVIVSPESRGTLGARVFLRDQYARCCPAFDSLWFCCVLVQRVNGPIMHLCASLSDTTDQLSCRQEESPSRNLARAL